MRSMSDEERVRNAETQLASFFAKYEPAMAKLGKALRAKLRDRLPGLLELVYVYESQDALVISYSPTETGSAAAAPIFAAFMRQAFELLPAREFVRPPGVVAVRTGDDYEYYKRGTEPGTGKGRTLDAATAMAKPSQYPEIGNGTDTTY